MISASARASIVSPILSLLLMGLEQIDPGASLDLEMDQVAGLGGEEEELNQARERVGNVRNIAGQRVGEVRSCLGNVRNRMGW